MTNPYTIILDVGGYRDEAEAEDLGGALLAARTLCSDRGDLKLRFHVIITKNGVYDSFATKLAKAGRTQ